MALDASELLAAAAYHWQQNRRLLPMYLHLLLSALFPIYTGAHASLSRPASAAEPLKRKSDCAAEIYDGDDEEAESVQQMEGLTPRDAVIFPIMAGTVLAGLYWLIKTYGPGVINTILGVYFSLIGTYSVAKLINDSWATISSLLMPAYYHDQGKLWSVHNDQRTTTLVEGAQAEVRSSPLAGFLGRLPLPRALVNMLWNLRDLVKRKYRVAGYAQGLFDFKAVATRHTGLSAVMGLVAVAYSLLVDRPWWLTNLQGFSVSYGALQLMSPTTFATGTLILSGLFFYDIWAVFFTPLMVTVAKNLDVPIKLVFPRPDEPPTSPGEKPTRSYSMLGLGDIVLPGLLIALCLRFDLHMHYVRKQKKVHKQECDNDVGTITTEVEKAPYVIATGNWGEKLWTTGSNHAQLPPHLSSRWGKPYFTASVVGYVFGMIATLGCMAVFQHAQPALLYLVPGVLIATWGTALVRGELSEMWAYSEAITGEAEEEGVQQAADPKESKGFFAELWGDIFGSAAGSKDDEQKKSADQGLREKAKAEPENVLSFTISTYTKMIEERKSDTSRGNTSGEDEDSVPISNADLDEGNVTRLRTASSQRTRGKK